MVADNGGITSNDRPVALCSESERWRCQASLQLTLGAITGSKVVVLDRADILDYNTRDGLIKAVSRVSSKTDMAVLVCTTYGESSAPGEPSDVAARGDPKRQD